ncbi:M23 family metallopeptidase [Namhaeicola litoreus]|uniref:M23 family metallopeptidase n=1 Tax=Namhaeicola litoreus TaxID=1052145 RepID=A0ABW3Y3C7_9FLAO
MTKQLSPVFFMVFFIYHSFGQQNYPKDYFINPLEIPLVLSGTFGELRSNHFHGGLDIKTQQVQGLKVVASAEGYISRINVAHWSYGKALYVTHPNGYTTVYGHLREFSPAIQDYVKKQQYSMESYEVQLYPQANELSVSKGELIAYSGNSGSSGGPHLHYEIRNSKAEPHNPLLFGISIPDHKSPIFKNAIAYAINDSSHVNQITDQIELVLKPNNLGNLDANTIYAYGKIGLGVNVTDRQDGAINNNGIYNLEMEVNNKKIFQYTVNSFSFSESRYINNFFDFERYDQKKQRVIKCFKEPNTHLSVYQNLVNDGYLFIKDSTEYNVKISAFDFKGNQTDLLLKIVGKKDSIIKKKKEKITPYYFQAAKQNEINDSLVKAFFPKDIFYKDLFFDYKFEDGIASFHNSSVPIHGDFTMSFNIKNYSEEDLKQMYIARKNFNKFYYQKSYRKGDWLTAKNNELGDYKLMQDTNDPIITPVNIKDQQVLNRQSTIVFKISDKDSGIKSYRGEINGKFALFEYDPKTGRLVYDLNDRTWDEDNYNLTLKVIDNVNNSATFSATFTKKD